MAHFAEIDDNNIVVRVLVVPDEQEHRGQDFLANDLGLGGTWIQCSYNNRIRKQYPGPGCIYDSDADVFITPKPYASWTLDENHDWQAPVPMPEEVIENYEWVWNEDNLEWESVLNER